MKSSVTTVNEYLESLPEDRRKDISKLRKVILANLPKGFKEAMNWGMISYEIPLSYYPDTYNGQPLSFAAIASQKNYVSLYLMSVYGNPKIEKWFFKEYKKSGKKLNMGKSCLRFKKLDEVPLGLIKKVIARTSVDEYIDYYEASRRKRK